MLRRMRRGGYSGGLCNGGEATPAAGVWRPPAVGGGGVGSVMAVLVVGRLMRSWTWWGCLAVCERW